MIRTLIAGGTGFIGQNLALHLHDMGHEIVAIGTNQRPCPKLLSRNIKPYFGDLSKTKLNTIIDDTSFDYAINLSGYINHEPLDKGGHVIYETHTKCALNLINSLDRKRLRTFVQVGTSDEYGNAKAPQNESQREECLAPYSLAKLANTHLAQLLFLTESFPSIVVRPFLVYGPGQSSDRLIPSVIKHCLQNEFFDTSPGEQLRDFLFVEDFCKGVSNLLGRKDLCGRVFNLASGNPTSVRQIIETLINEIGAGRANFGGREYRIGENMALFADISAISEATSWKPQTPIVEGLRQTIAAATNKG